MVTGSAPAVLAQPGELKRRLMVCRRPDQPLMIRQRDDVFTIHGVGNVPVGTQAPRGRNGQWLCPHRGYPLGTEPERSGLLVCPMHGLCIDAKSGRSVGMADIVGRMIERTFDISKAAV